MEKEREREVFDDACDRCNRFVDISRLEKSKSVFTDVFCSLCERELYHFIPSVIS